MLHQLADPMAIPVSTRRAAQAAVVTLSLMQAQAGTFAPPAEDHGSHVRVQLGGFSLWATRCDPPLLVEDALTATHESGRDVLILRLQTSVGSRLPVAFDWFSARGNQGAPRFSLAPALPSDGGLSLIPSTAPDLRLNVTAAGIVVHQDVTPLWAVQRDLAIARAVAVFRAQLRGGF
jgi:hypothetical protein